MRRSSIIPMLLIVCSFLLSTNTVFAVTEKEELDIENIKAPPRDVKDILRLVEQTKPDLEVVERAKKVVATPLPVTEDNEVLNHYFTRRSAAYEDLGNTGEALRSLEVAVKKYPSTNPRLYINDLINLSVLENSAGKQSTAIALI